MTDQVPDRDTAIVILEALIELRDYLAIPNTPRLEEAQAWLHELKAKSIEPPEYLRYKH